tara:strand:+ start:1008 stop:1232 length:225 start_codon:yes stop_codon:yes gene_type:complete
MSPQITKKVNHSSLWIKVSWPFGWGKIKITRNGETFEATSQKALDEIRTLWDNTSDKRMSYGERMQAVEDEVRA